MVLLLCPLCAELRPSFALDLRVILIVEPIVSNIVAKCGHQHTEHINFGEDCLIFEALVHEPGRHLHNV